MGSDGRGVSRRRRRHGRAGSVIVSVSPRFSQPRQPALLTTDIDVTVPGSLPIRDEQTLRERLEAGDFIIVPRRTVSRNAPSKHYFQHRRREGSGLAAIHGEFLTPLKGPATDRDGNPKSPRKVQKGLSAEALRYMDLLLWEPISLDLSNIYPTTAPAGLEIRLPNVGTFVVQNALCSQKRDRLEKRDKDLAYIYDVATLTHLRWDEIREHIEELRVEGPCQESWWNEAADILEKAFITDTPFGPEAVAAVYENEQSVLASTVRHVVRRFLEGVGLSDR